MPRHCLTSPSETNTKRTTSEKKFRRFNRTETPNRKIPFLVFLHFWSFFRVIFSLLIFNGLEFIFLCLRLFVFSIHSALAYHACLTRQQRRKERQRKAAKTTRRAWTHHLGGTSEEEKFTQILDQKERNGIKCGQLSSSKWSLFNELFILNEREKSIKKIRNKTRCFSHSRIVNDLEKEGACSAGAKV